MTQVETVVNQVKRWAWALEQKKSKCGERGSNTRPSDLQSDALPTELSPLAC